MKPLSVEDGTETKRIEFRAEGSIDGGQSWAWKSTFTEFAEAVSEEMDIAKHIRAIYGHMEDAGINHRVRVIRVEISESPVYSEVV